MARTFTVKKSGGTDYSPGWKLLTISKAKYDDYNGTQCLDMWFEGYPDSFNARVYATTGSNGEEFAIGNLFRFANAGITDALESANGETIIKMNDDAAELVGKTVNAYFYKDGKFTRALGQIAPVPFKNIVEEYPIFSSPLKQEQGYSQRYQPLKSDYPVGRSRNIKRMLENECVVVTHHSTTI